VPITVLCVIVVAAVFVLCCLTDLVRAQVRHLPKAAWAIIICFTVPWGGLAYLAFGRVWAAKAIAAPVPEAPPGPTPAPASVHAQLVPRRPRSAPVSVEVDRLVKRFGTVTAVDALSFTVRPGTVTGFLGPNGAGKTTTMRMLLGLNAPSAGAALIGGRRYQDFTRPLYEVGALLDATAVPAGRSALHHLLALAQSNGIGRRRVNEVLELTGLAAVATRRVGEFSLGMKQRLGIAAALLADPPVLLLDEPANGLDTDGIRWIRQLLRSMAAEGRTVLISSHLMSEMALTADHLIIIGRGRLLADTPTAQFVSAARRDVLVRTPWSDELAGLMTAAGAAVTREDDGALAVTGLDAPAVGELAAAHGLALHELIARHASLEDAYLAITGDSADYQAGNTSTGDTSPGSAGGHSTGAGNTGTEGTTVK
jgi:ABC-2 type transport system ATP-binding protein